MIWFACRQCGKQHGRPEASAGSLIFCECGHGNIVPWESTIAEPAAPLPAPAGPPPVPPPILEAVPLGEERIPSRPRRPTRRAEERRPEPRQVREEDRDPNYCFNHTALPAEHTCTDCGEHFCSHCVITFRGETLCGPCKNFRIRQVNKPPRVSVLAVVSVCLGLIFGPAALCLIPAGQSTELAPFVVLVILVQLLALILGGLALYKTEQEVQLRGKGLAISGVVMSGFGLVLSLAATVFSLLHWA